MGDHGDAECFFADINGDGQPEIIAYQGPGVFGARMFRALPHVSLVSATAMCFRVHHGWATIMNLGRTQSTGSPVHFTRP